MIRILYIMMSVILLTYSCKNNISSKKEYKPVYPVKVSNNNRYLVDQNDVPYFINSDTPWSIFVAIKTEEAETYLEDRKQKGFTSITVNLIEHWFNGDTTAYPYASINKYGHAPFLAMLNDTIVDMSKPDEAYFAHADSVIKMALERNILVMMTPAYTGYIKLKEGWYNELIINGPERCREYGRFLGKRFKDFPNILWIMDGDRNPDSLLKICERALVAGIKEYDTLHLFTSHCHPSNSSRDHWEGEPWLDLNAVYTYNWKAYVHEKALENYSRQPAMPCFLFETCYENEHKYTAAQVRAGMYWGWLCTIAGQQMGNKPIWFFGKGWREQLNSQLSNDAMRLRNLAESRKWYNLVPDNDHKVLTSGYGEKKNFAACARTADGETIIAYLPTDCDSIQINMQAIEGKTAKAWWYDPLTGMASLLGEFMTNGIRTFTKPDSNDRVLVIDRSSARLPSPGTQL